MNTSTHFQNVEVAEVFQNQYIFKVWGVQKNLSKTATLKNENCFQDQLSLNAGQKYCRMLKWEHSAILSTYIELPFVIKIYVLSIFEWPFTVPPECGKTSLNPDQVWRSVGPVWADKIIEISLGHEPSVCISISQ